MNCPKRHLLAVAILLSVTFWISGRRASADVLANYEFNEISLNNFSRASTDVNSHSTAGNFLDGPAFVSTSFEGLGNPGPGIGITANQTPDNVDDAVALNKYWSFTIAPVAGEQLALTNLTFEVAAVEPLSVLYKTRVAVRSSVDAFAANLGLVADQAHAGISSFSPADVVDLSSLPAQSGSVEFRLYVFDNTSLLNHETVLDNVILNGISGAPGPPLGDFNHDLQVTAADIPAMLVALADMNAYRATYTILLDADLIAIGDFDNSHSVTNGDIQGLLDLVASQVGGGSVAAVPEPGTFILAALGLFAASVFLPLIRKKS